MSFKWTIVIEALSLDIAREAFDAFVDSFKI